MSDKLQFVATLPLSGPHPKTVNDKLKFVGHITCCRISSRPTTTIATRLLAEGIHMNKSRTLVTIVVLLLAGSVPATASNSAPDLSTLAWLAGNWTGTKDGVEMEELWQKPKGNSMLAVHRDVKEGRTVSFEFLRIEATADAITYWASPRGRPATPFKMIEHGNKRVVFENPEHDFPRRIIYWVTTDGLLHAKIEGTLSGQPASEEWTWRRSAL